MRKATASLLVFSLIICMLSPAFAHDDQNAHDRDLRYALFGDKEKNLIGDEKTAFQAIADAAAVTIDQFSPNDTLEWKKGTYEDLQSGLEALSLAKLDIPFKDLDLNIHVWDNTKNTEAKNITAKIAIANK